VHLVADDYRDRRRAEQPVGFDIQPARASTAWRAAANALNPSLTGKTRKLLCSR